MVITVRLYIPSVSFMAALEAHAQPVPASPERMRLMNISKGRQRLLKTVKKGVHLKRVGDESETKIRLEIAAFQA